MRVSVCGTLSVDPLCAKYLAVQVTKNPLTLQGLVDEELDIRMVAKIHLPPPENPYMLYVNLLHLLRK